MTNQLLIIGLAGGEVLLSNLVAWALVGYLSSRPPLSRNILTHLNTSLVLAYNLHTSLAGLGLILRSALGPLPPLVGALLIFVVGLGYFTLVGLHVALASMRYLLVTWFTWLQPQVRG